MLNSDAKLSAKVFSDDVERASTRDGFGRGVVEAGKADSRVVVLCADVKDSTRAEEFEKEFPERFIEMGVAEQNMVTVAAGMAAAGKIPFIASYAIFSPGRNYEQIRTTIALNNVPVKICGMHAGISVGADGATHQMLEDIGMMRMLPRMTVLVPGDAEETRKAVIVAAKTDGPVYIRFGRSTTPIFTTPETPFQIGKALILWESHSSDGEPRVAIFSTGSLSYAALTAARALSDDGIGSVVLHIPTVKPLDIEAVSEVVQRTDCIVTVEEHQIAGGFGSAVAEFLAEHHPMLMRRVGVNDQFGQSGEPHELLAYYGLDAPRIREAVRKLARSL
ncbi:MAG: transketolase C-terminal domain-containing protein [Minisyncoccia bacterium]|jgi:transketolase